LGLGYLGSVLRGSGFNVKISDMYNFSWKEVELKIKQENPDVVGISCCTAARLQAVKLAHIAKKCNSNIRIIMGGPHPTFFPEHMFKLSPTDVVVMGEGERTIVELMDAMEKNEDISKIDGIAFRKNATIIRTNPRPLIENLDSIPFPIYDFFDLKKYQFGDILKEYRKLISTYIITSRGCPFGCQFCSTSRYWGRRWRTRSVKNVIDELRFLYDKLNVRFIYFVDDILTLDSKRTIDLCKSIIDEKVDLVWMTETRVDCVNREMLQWMKKAGCYKIMYGIESGSPEILKTINKGFSVNQIKEAFKLTHETGIQPKPLLMVGNPGENNNTIDQTISLLKEIKPVGFPHDIALTWVFPNTPLYEMAKSKGLISDEYWLTSKPTPYYTGDHSKDELMMLALRLIKGVLPKSEFTKYIITWGAKSLIENPKLPFRFVFNYLKRKMNNL